MPINAVKVEKSLDFFCNLGWFVAWSVVVGPALAVSTPVDEETLKDSIRSKPVPLPSVTYISKVA